MGLALVVDASALVDITLLGYPSGSINGAELHCPTVVDYEVLSTMRRYARLGAPHEAAAESGLADFAALDIERHPAPPLLPWIWALRDNFTMYDAAYVALAMTLGVPLRTHDLRLARSASRHCEVLTE